MVVESANIDVIDRPTGRLPTSTLLRISMFWLGLTAIDATISSSTQSRLKYDGLVASDDVGTSLAILAAMTFIFSFFIQPTVGSISDYTTSRWGRRKP